MKKIRDYLIIFALCLVTANLFFLTQKPSYEYLKSKTVFVDQRNSSGEIAIATGTGVILAVKDGITYILTNHHMCTGTENTNCFINYNEEIIRTVLLKTDKSVDLSLLATNYIFTDKSPIHSLENPKMQQNIYYAGNAMGIYYYIYSEGEVAYLHEKVFFGLSPLIIGHSGSGVFNRKGELVGLLSARVTGSGYSISINANMIQQFLGEYLTLIN